MFWPLISLSVLSIVSALPFPADDAVGVVWQFPNKTWIENLAVRQNGEILATSLNRGAIYLVNPFSHTEITVHEFGNGEGVLGIAEIQNDVFIAVTAEVDLVTSTSTVGSAKAWKVDMAAWCLGEANAVSLAASLAKAGLPDGVVALSEPGLVLVADAAKGIVWRLESTTGDYTVAIQSDLFRPTNPLIPLGVDGLHIANDQLYFSNLAGGFLGRVPIDAYGNATGAVEIVANLTFPDDFALATDGTAYVVGANTLYRVSPSGMVNMLAGGMNDTTLEGATSAQFGRTRDDSKVLYIGTNGGILAPVNGRIVGGQISAVNVGSFD